MTKFCRPKISSLKNYEISIKAEKFRSSFGCNTLASPVTPFETNALSMLQSASVDRISSTATPDRFPKN